MAGGMGGDGSSGTGGTGGTAVYGSIIANGSAGTGTGGGGGGSTGAVPGYAGGVNGGGAGGRGGYLGTSTTVGFNNLAVTGGDGVAGSPGTNVTTVGGATLQGGGGGGGAGGYGIIISNLNSSYGIFLNQGVVAGGAGGAGGSSTFAYGNGGDGGIGLDVAAPETLVNSADVTGGTGGSAGAASGFGIGGNGGVGIAASGGTIVNSATLTGGDGGTARQSGLGGAGVSASNETIFNTGAIKGGDEPLFYSTQFKGSQGVVGSTLTIANDGSIKGGMAGAQQASSLDFTGGTNVLAIGTKATFSGPIANEGGTLQFNQAAATSFTAAGTDFLPNATLGTSIYGAGAVQKLGDGTLTLTGDNSYRGGTTINEGKLELGLASSAGTAAINFAPASGHSAALALQAGAQPGNGGTFANTLVGFGAAATSLDLEGLTYGSVLPGTPEVYDPTTSTLAVAENGTTEDFTLGSPGALAFYAHDDGNGGTLVDDNPLCFVTGTRIRTTRGDVRVERLVAGDVAVTASGAHRPIRWIGHRSVRFADHAVPSDMWPVRIRAGAFGPQRPSRDLHLSPGHPVLIGGAGSEVLVPIMCLINGTTIARVARDRLTYWHVELDRHDILLADNLPAESFLDYGIRPWFDEGADHDLHNPDVVAPGLAGRCRPVAVDGPQVEMERRRLDQIFATGLSAQCDWPVADEAFAIGL